MQIDWDKVSIYIKPGGNGHAQAIQWINAHCDRGYEERYI